MPRSPQRRLLGQRLAQCRLRLAAAGEVLLAQHGAAAVGARPAPPASGGEEQDQHPPAPHPPEVPAAVPPPVRRSLFRHRLSLLTGAPVIPLHIARRAGCSGTAPAPRVLPDWPRRPMVRPATSPLRGPWEARGRPPARRSTEGRARPGKVAEVQDDGGGPLTGAPPPQYTLLQRK